MNSALLDTPARLSRVAPAAVLFVCLGLAFALSACSDSDSKTVSLSSPSSGDLTVNTQQGTVKGTDKDAMREFLGLPYAAPPVSDLRWKPPQPPESFAGVRDASQFANHCPQPGSPFGVATTSEDCLYLNVFTPRKNTGSLPVMVWIHGGALQSGESDDYNPAPLVSDGVIVVTINYRLGILGFLAHPALSAEAASGASGDYGLMDQQAALKWVQNNIAAFGGGPGNVTVFGESAGGLSTLAQIVSPQAKGLFNKAIIESGSYSQDQPTLAQAETQGKAFANKAGCSDQTATCLRGLSVAQILKTQGTSLSGFIPNTGTPILPQSIGTTLKSGQFNQVPVIEGTNRNEWRLFVALSYDLMGGPLKAAQYPAAIQQWYVDVSVADAAVTQTDQQLFAGTPL